MRYVLIELDRPRRLRYDINALAELEDALGGSLFEAFQQQRQMGVKFLRLLIWGGLRWEDRALTLVQAGDLLQLYLENGKSLEDLIQVITKALELSGLTGSSADSPPPVSDKGGII